MKQISRANEASKLKCSNVQLRTNSAIHSRLVWTHLKAVRITEVYTLAGSTQGHSTHNRVWVQHVDSSVQLSKRKRRCTASLTWRWWSGIAPVPLYPKSAAWLSPRWFPPCESWSPHRWWWCSYLQQHIDQRKHHKRSAAMESATTTLMMLFS